MKRSTCIVAVMSLAAGCSGLLAAAGGSAYVKALTIGAGTEWRFHPLVVDLNGDSRPDLVATARLADNPLRIWFGDGKGGLNPVEATWSETGYAALATGDINRDGFPDIVAASHFRTVQTLLSDGKGGFAEKILRRNDGYVAAQLADFDGDGLLDLALVGYQKAGIEIHRGDGTGNWSLHATLPDSKPGPTMAGRDLLVADLNHDGHADLLAAFQRWGIYVYYGDGRGGFAGGPATFRSPEDTPEALALGDVNNDGHLDIAVNGNHGARDDEANGPDLYLGNGRGEWKASSGGLKVFKFASGGIALADLDRDGHMDIVAGGNMTGDVDAAQGLFLFRGDGKGGWQLVRESGLPASGLWVPHGVALADLDADEAAEIIALSGGTAGSITIWKRHKD